MKGKTTATGGFGDRLRREREMRGITLDEISESTKIARRHLEALEKEQFDQLPGGVFNKGFVKAYARFLGLDEDQAVADYAAVANEKTEPEDKFPLEIHEKPDEKLKKPKRSLLPAAFVAAALVGILVGYVIWAKSRPHTSETTHALQQSSPAVQTETPTQASTTQPSTPQASTPAAVSSGAAATAAPVAATPAPSQRAERGAAPPPQQQSGNDAATVKPEKTFSVSIKAKEDSWVSIVADGKSVMQRVLNADKHKKIKAGKSLVLRTGNAGGIEVSFNGRPLGVLGNENEPRTLTFNAAGLVQ